MKIINIIIFILVLFFLPVFGVHAQSNGYPVGVVTNWDYSFVWEDVGGISQYTIHFWDDNSLFDIYVTLDSSSVCDLGTCSYLMFQPTDTLPSYGNYHYDIIWDLGNYGQTDFTFQEVSMFPLEGVVAVCGFTILLWWIPRPEIRMLPLACALLFQPYWLEAAFSAYCTALLLGTWVFMIDAVGAFSNS